MTLSKWKTVEIRELGKVFSGGTPATNNPTYWNGEVNWCTPTDITALTNRFLGATVRKLSEKGLKNSSATVLPIGSVVVCTRATIGICAITTVEMTTNQGFKSIVPNDKTTADFLYYLVNHIKPELQRLSSGSTFGEVSKSAFEKIKVELPPYAEQKKIAEILSAWDDAIENTSALIIAKVQLKKGLIQQLLTGKKRFPEFAGQQWRRMKISDFTTQAIRVHPKPERAFLALGIRSHGKGTFLKPDFDPAKIEMTELYEVRENDLIVNITFAWEGAIAIAGAKDNGALVSHRFPTYEFNTQRAIPEYFRHVIVQKCFVEKLGLISPGGAGRNRVLSKKDFGKLEVLMPSVEEQRRIAAVLNACGKEIELLIKQRDALKAQKRGLMQQLLTGKKRVKVDEQAEREAVAI
jgi:type I restriction enzyme S subunit